ncbi:MAG TPA: hypothetical protein VNO21_26070 [Polyangiaceae bacterium]|nr:hypothetical protein [Polyangiaceae bacterium]
MVLFDESIDAVKSEKEVGQAPSRRRHLHRHTGEGQKEEREGRAVFEIVEGVELVEIPARKEIVRRLGEDDEVLRLTELERDGAGENAGDGIDDEEHLPRGQVDGVAHRRYDSPRGAPPQMTSSDRK